MNEMVGWHNQHNENEFQQTLVDGEGQGSPACSSLWGCKDLDTTEQLNNIKLQFSPWRNLIK